MGTITPIPSGALEIKVWGFNDEESRRNAKEYAGKVKYLQDAGFSNHGIDEMIALRSSSFSDGENGEAILQSPDSSTAEIRGMLYLQALDDIVSCVFAGKDFNSSEFLDEMREQNTSGSYDFDARSEAIPEKTHSWKELFSLESWKELFSFELRIGDFVSHPAVRTLGCAAAGITAVCLAPNIVDFFMPAVSAAEASVSAQPTHTYVVDDDFQVVLRELKREGPDLYQIDINITNPSGPYRLIEEASMLMVSKAFVVPEGVKMYYNTSKSDEWVLITRAGREDHALLRGGFGLYKKFIPPVGVVERILKGMVRTFEYIDSKKPNIVKPKHLVSYKPGAGLNYEFFVPVSMIKDKLSPTGLYGLYVDGVRFDIPVEELAESGFFVKFGVGQHFSAITASKQYGVEIVDRDHPIMTGQIRGRLIDFGRSDGILVDKGQQTGPYYKITFVSERDGNPEIYVVDSYGTNTRRLTDNPSNDTSPSWSSNGNKIAFASDRDRNDEIYVMDIDGINVIRLTNNPANDRDPAWSPDGEQIIFVSDRDGNNEIYIMNDDGSGQRRLTKNFDNDVEPSWSYDSEKIMFRSQRGPFTERTLSDRDTNREIYVMGVDGTGQRRLTNDPISAGEPSCSSDGARIAFVSERNGNREIYIHASGLHDRRLTKDNNPDYDPSWSPLLRRYHTSPILRAHKGLRFSFLRELEKLEIHDVEKLTEEEIQRMLRSTALSEAKQIGFAAEMYWDRTGIEITLRKDLPRLIGDYVLNKAIFVVNNTLTDPWNNPFFLTHGRIYSAGPNKIDEKGKGDDIPNIE